MELTIGELVVLGALAERPRHGYDIEQVIEERGVRRWTDIGFSSIYYLLDKLTARGLAEADDDRPSPKARRVVRITDRGRRTAAADVRELLSDAGVPARSFLAGLAHSTLLSTHEAEEALRARLAGLDARIGAVVAARTAQEPLPSEARDVFSFSLSQLRAERSWLTERVQVSDD
ncbi:PadR family transcriptional regulator [Pseudonocardia sp. HH130629-09]|uniref:PadR family transcriptional regulator n=1 Tax=Pseudonocardia sp. HH130629-09 TaxID=1641402 RepID=UPI0006CB691E|nr:PadR family transcriptional regulator [Pseudonocardia sp. HH130629-09]ALE85586.1 PadR family transcriptional regulator [Pseudonocardia sp. HH130629-09]